MAKKKKEKLPPFKSEGMTVDEIINIGDDELSKWSRRDLSRALRTVALAANKRISRLEKHAIKTVNEQGDVKYTEKSQLGIDFEALYYTEGKRFGVGKSHDRNEIYKEFARVRNFLNAPSTTIKGAVELRKKRELAVFGQTSEEMTKGMSKEDKFKTISQMKDVMTDVYSEFHKWKEEYSMQGGYTKERGKRVIRMLARRMHNKGMSGEEARQSVSDYYDKKYEKEQQQELITNTDDPFDLLDNSSNNDDWRNW